MTRDLTTAATDRTLADRCEPIWLVDLEFVSGWLYLWSGHGEITWNSKTYLGVGDLGTVESVSESDDLRAESVRLTMTGLDPDLLALSLGDFRQSKTARVHLGFLSEGALVADPYTAFEGLMDVPTIDEGADTATITLTCESRLITLQKPRLRRYTDEDQQAEHPGDLGMEYVTVATGKVLWSGGLPDYKTDLGFSID